MPGHLTVVREPSQGGPLEGGVMRNMSGDTRPAEGAAVITVHTDRAVYADNGMAALTGEICGDGGRLPEFIEKLVRALRLYRSVVRRAPYVCQYETELAFKDGKRARAAITASEILWQGDEAFMIFVRVL